MQVKRWRHPGPTDQMRRHGFMTRSSKPLKPGVAIAEKKALEKLSATVTDLAGDMWSILRVAAQRPKTDAVVEDSRCSTPEALANPLRAGMVSPNGMPVPCLSPEEYMDKVP